MEIDGLRRVWVFGGVLGFAVAVAALHSVQPELDPMRDAISCYVHGRGGWLLSVGLLALDGASFALLPMLRGRGARFWFGLWCFGVLLGTVFPADPPGSWNRPSTVSGAVHGIAALAAFAGLTVAAVLSGGGRGMRWLGWTCAVSLGAFLVSLAPAMVWHRAPWLLGLTERVMVAVYCAWIVVAAISLKSAGIRYSESPTPYCTRKSQAVS